MTPTSLLLAAKLPQRLHHFRTFVNARVKWVRDPFLDTTVSKEKDLKQVLSFKNQIIYSPKKSLPLAALSPLKSHIDLPITVLKFFQKYPSVFTQFQPGPSLPLHAKLTPQAVTLHKEESAIHGSPTQQDDAVKRLDKLLMLTNVRKLPLQIINRFKFDLGLPYNYIAALLADYPEYFQVCEIRDCISNKEMLGWS